jgi:acyl-CoA dehydrogenase
MSAQPDSAKPFDTAERVALSELTADFTRREIVPHLQEWEDTGTIPRELHKAAASVGLLGINYPEEVGGVGGDSIDVTVVTEALLTSGGSGGLFAGLFSHGIAVPHIIDAATREREAGNKEAADWLVEEWVRPVLNGEKIAALGVTEPDGGSDVASLRTRAIRDGDEWVLNGAKTYITSGARADVVVIAARIGDPGAAGVALFAVDTTLTGFEVSRRLSKMGWHCSDTAELSLVDVRVPAAALLTPEPGGGFASLARHFAVERLSLATMAYSTAQRCLDLTVEWTQNRETFGRPLAQRQVIRHTLVEMYRQIEVARTYARAVAVRNAAGEGVLLEAILAKNTAVAACDYVVDQAVQLHGGLGYMHGTEVERHYRDSKVLAIGGGATEVMTDLAARLLGW